MNNFLQKCAAIALLVEMAVCVEIIAMVNRHAKDTLINKIAYAATLASLIIAAIHTWMFLWMFMWPTDTAHTTTVETAPGCDTARLEYSTSALPCLEK
jgi:hypothetical protein